MISPGRMSAGTVHCSTVPSGALTDMFCPAIPSGTATSRERTRCAGCGRPMTSWLTGAPSATGPPPGTPAPYLCDSVCGPARGADTPRGCSAQSCVRSGGSRRGASPWQASHRERWKRVCSSSSSCLEALLMFSIGTPSWGRPRKARIRSACSRSCSGPCPEPVAATPPSSRQRRLSKNMTATAKHGAESLPRAPPPPSSRSMCTRRIWLSGRTNCALPAVALNSPAVRSKQKVNSRAFAQPKKPHTTPTAPGRPMRTIAKKRPT
mmetsp:Transcript_17890/g.49846  ORF Transcript_17890/g.49846 Transcript_17890/m.49846 type:complete len:265 (+) Transcript_17890:256-1050(+)